MLPVYCNEPDVHKRSRNGSSLGLVSNYHCLFLFVGTRPVAPLLLTAVGKYKTHPWKPSRVTVFHGLNWLGVESSPDRVQDQFSQANRTFSERTKKGREHKTFKKGEGGARFLKCRLCEFMLAGHRGVPPPPVSGVRRWMQIAGSGLFGISLGVIVRSDPTVQLHRQATRLTHPSYQAPI